MAPDKTQVSLGILREYRDKQIKAMEALQGNNPKGAVAILNTIEPSLMEDNLAWIRKTLEQSRQKGYKGPIAELLSVFRRKK